MEERKSHFLWGGEGEKLGSWPEFLRTWDDVPEPDGGHGDEAEVEGLEEGPLLPDGEDAGADAQEDGLRT